MGRRSCHPDTHPVCVGVVQCPGGLPQQIGSDHLYRVDFSPGHLQSTVEALELPHSGPVSHKAQLPASELCLTISGANGNSHGRFPVQLRSPGRIWFSSLPVDQEGSQQVEDSSLHHPHPDCTILATERVVPRSHTGFRGLLPVPSTLQGPSLPAPRL